MIARTPAEVAAANTAWLRRMRVRQQWRLLVERGLRANEGRRAA